MRVKQFYNKNQFIIYDKNIKVFQSYDSTIAEIKKGTLTLFNNWDYSNTTRKHLYLFIRDYADDIWAYICDKNSKRKEIEKLIKDKEIKYKNETE